VEKIEGSPWESQSVSFLRKTPYENKLLPSGGKKKKTATIPGRGRSADTRVRWGKVVLED